ncbi:hypothetical protein [Alsobacter ponti]|nr:hypothetical protein [Alsobacter ponti]
MTGLGFFTFLDLLAAAAVVALLLSGLAFIQFRERPGPRLR